MKHCTIILVVIAVSLAFVSCDKKEVACAPLKDINDYLPYETGDTVWFTSEAGVRIPFTVDYAGISRTRPYNNPNHCGSWDGHAALRGNHYIHLQFEVLCDEQVEGHPWNGKVAFFSQYSVLANLINMNAIFDEEGNMTPVDFGDTVGLPAPNGDTVAVLAKGYGMTSFKKNGHCYTLDTSSLPVR